MTFLDITKPAASTSRAVHSPSLAAHNRQLGTIVLNTWKAAAGRDRAQTGTGSKHLTLKHTVLWRQAVEHCRAGGAQGAAVARRAGIGSGHHFTTEPDPLAGRPPAVTAAQQHSADPTDIVVMRHACTPYSGHAKLPQRPRYSAAEVPHAMGLRAEDQVNVHINAGTHSKASSIMLSVCNCFSSSHMLINSSIHA